MPSIIDDDYPNATERLDSIVGSGGRKKAHTPIAMMTGIASLDLFLGGGLPAGLVEIFGDPGVGKTALLAHVIAQAQRDGKTVLLAASEYLDLPYLYGIGVQDNLLVLKGGAEDPVSTMTSFLKENDNALLAIDSVTAIQTDDDELSWNEMMLWFFKKLNHYIGPRKCVVMTSQVRTKKSAVPGRSFSHGTESASRRLVDLFSTRLHLSTTEEKTTEYVLEVDIVSNILGRPGQVIALPAEKGTGINTGMDLLELAMANGIVDQKGSRFYHNEQMIGHGRTTAAKNIAFFSDLANDIWKDLAG